MIPRFNARNFTKITPEMLTCYKDQGVLVLEHLVSADTCDILRQQMAKLVQDFDVTEHRTVFSSTSEAHAQESYFLESGHKIHFFFEEGVFDKVGQLQKPIDLALNKAGHAMHDLDPVFNDFCRQPAFETITKGLGLVDPLLLQSMYIFKQPQIGGEVVCHQDATYLRTEPQSCIGLWVALEDATIENGCLWGIPGGHKQGGLKAAFRRDPETNQTWTEILDDTPYDEGKKIPLEVTKGSVIVFGGLFPHMSYANKSAHSRHAFTLHIIDKTTHYPADNWLTRPKDMPLRGF
ncbi:phytanoyl-CoA dioxygenase family protein [Kordiimonas pumila]|uniref:Phytanoyl-CoA dioxygenase family protein n=1 Tax=Kordiimonas pumila TaxID=2161677 RepID=A0ABV7D973_9PROT|nr:phytanoyl-CoA dioxygenase family protein [Kordiimonas pumila]